MSSPSAAAADPFRADAPASHEDAPDALDFCRTRLPAVEDQVKVVENGPLKAWNPNS